MPCPLRATDCAPHHSLPPLQNHPLFHLECGLTICLWIVHHGHFLRLVLLQRTVDAAAHIVGVSHGRFISVLQCISEKVRLLPVDTINGCSACFIYLFFFRGLTASIIPQLSDVLAAFILHVLISQSWSMGDIDSGQRDVPGEDCVRVIIRDFLFYAECVPTSKALLN